MKDKIIVFIASVKEREQQLKIVINSIKDKVDLIHLVLNWYDEVPKWLKAEPRVFCHLNPNNKNAHDAVWQYVEAENEVLKVTKRENYYFICDDDLLYPADYFDKLIECIECHERRAVVTVHGANIQRPVKSYFECRCVYGFSDRLERDIFVDMAGIGVTAFHSSTIKPTLQNFPFVYCRDLWFSILCARNKIKIVSLKRPQNWISPLKTFGDSVYETTKNSKNLSQLKDRILKETFLPLLDCNQDNDKYVLITDYDFEEQLLLKSLATLDDVTKSNVVIFSNKLKIYAPGNVLTQYVTAKELAIGMMGSKVVTQYRFINGLKDGSKVISADADLYYLKDPFTAFEQDFDIAVTTRGYNYRYPINAGIIMFRVNNKVRDLLNYMSNQIFERTWARLIDFQKNHRHEGNNWYIDQDILCTAWLCKEQIRERFGVKIIDVGHYYNFCPHADGNSTEEGKQQLMKAYNEKSVSVLHLKSRLKELLFDGLLK